MVSGNRFIKQGRFFDDNSETPIPKFTSIDAVVGSIDAPVIPKNVPYRDLLLSSMSGDGVKGKYDGLHPYK